ncbi:FAD binding domain-containing protein [Hirsutella rhossiliensis]|uniref:Delta(24)-sterol reductase n=1 Tax=Hirsutella rhossiliensis TaxID=111463 RepID=A0A9P8MZ31_9HYPO|nr:FAD binding domain-containing protein [Hirsutella rhossiliensis]KAH0965063.1 FAD binding domain-containing protein [Hirsutella rhossiliensis]
MQRHREIVNDIAASVRALFDRGEPYRIAHGSTNSTRPRPGRAQAAFVDISALSHVVAVDAAARTALVEANVPMDRLVEATLRHGLVPPVVMEFPGITAGGGFAGTAGESSSFRHGFFDECVNFVEMVLGNGDVVRAAPDERPDLFRGAAGALGTLGIVTMMELRLVEAKRWVKTTYHRTTAVAHTLAKLRAETGDPANHYVDGILFSPNHGVVVSGSMTDDKPADVAPQTFSRAKDPWFYLHARAKTEHPSTTATDYIPLAEYLFRYDRGGFWVGEGAFSIFKLPFNRFFRWLLDDLLHTRMLYRARHASGTASSSFVIQDLALPYATAGEFVDYTASNFGIWPLWLCPLKHTLLPTFHPNTASTCTGSYSTAAPSPTAAPDQVVSIGLWGWGPLEHDAFVAANRALENKLAQLGGRKWLYAQTFYSEDEFWGVYAGFRGLYTALREKYHATTLPTMYDKVCPEARRQPRRRSPAWLAITRPVKGVYGIWKGILSGDHKMHRNAEWKYVADSSPRGAEKAHQA